MRIDSLKELMPVVYCGIPAKISSYEFKNQCICFREHWHERMELIFVESGSIDICVNGEKSFCAGKGETAVFCPGDRHSGSCAESVGYFVISFDLMNHINSTEAAKSLLLPLARSKIAFEKKVCDESVFALAKKVKQEAESPDEASPIMIEGYLYQILGRLFRGYVGEKTAVPEGTQRFKMVYDYIAQNISDRLSTGKLCGIFGYDESYFCRRFKAETGCTPSEYIRIMRLEKSLEMLKNKSSVSDAAAYCGFSSPLYFSRCFKAKYKMTPTEYIKNQSQN